MLPYISQIAEKASFFSVLYLGYHFIIANTIRLNLAVPKISKASQEHISGGVLC